MSPRTEQAAKMKAIIAKMDRMVKEEVRGESKNESIEGALGEVDGRGGVATLDRFLEGSDLGEKSTLAFFKLLLRIKPNTVHYLKRGHIVLCTG